MEISVARKRLEEMRADLDRTVSILLGEHHLVRGGGAEPGDAGANLTEADRNAAAMETTVPVQDGRLGRVRLSVNNTTVATASPTTPATIGHIRRCHGNRRGWAVTRSVTGIGSWPKSLVKVANSGPRPG